MKIWQICKEDYAGKGFYCKQLNENFYVTKINRSSPIKGENFIYDLFGNVSSAITSRCYASTLALLDFTPIIDWTTVKIDTRIYVKNSEDDNWLKRNFAMYKDGKVYAWNKGRSSFTALNDNDFSIWEYAKLAE